MSIQEAITKFSENHKKAVIIDEHILVLLAVREYLDEIEMSESTREEIKNSKVGDITVTKISKNDGYVKEGESAWGVTAAFGEGLSVYIASANSWFCTSTIRKIDWDKKEFTTRNSVYSFTFKETNII